MRIWSLLPSATEILFALGLGDQITGVTHECDEPPEAASKPRVTMSYVNSSTRSGEIDRQVTERFRAGQQIYGIVEDRLREDPPDLIITQDLCPVCAVSPSDFAGHMADAGCSAPVVCLNPNTLEDVFATIHQIAEATGSEYRARDLIRSLRARLDAVWVATATTQMRRLLTLEWLDPVMPGGHWVPEMAEFAGGHAPPIPPGRPSRKVPWPELRALDPDVIVLMPCGFSPRRAADEAAVLWQLDGWQTMRAVEASEVYAVDGNGHFSRPGPRLVDGTEVLAAILHPDVWPHYPEGSILKLTSGSSDSQQWTSYDV